MGKKFYTCVQQIGSKIFHIYHDDDGIYHKEVVREDDYTLYIEANKKFDAVGLFGDRLIRLDFKKISDAKEYISEYSDITPIHGQTNFALQFISNHYPGKISFDPKCTNILVFDIEVESDDGFPFPDEASYPITAITAKLIGRGKYHTFSTGFYSKDDTNYFKCKDESDLIRRFISYWSNSEVEIVTGYNIDSFDLPYLINRAHRIGLSDDISSLSPFHANCKDPIREKRLTGKQSGYDILGVTVFDYIDLYKKFTYNSLESYSLNYVSHHELGEKKIDFSGAAPLYNFYKGSEKVTYDESKGISELADFQKWAKVRDKIKASLPTRKPPLRSSAKLMTPEEVNDIDLSQLSDEELCALFEFANQKADETAFEVAIDYNKKDVWLVEQLEEKLQFINIAMTVAYFTKCRLSDVYSSIRVWDSFLYNRLLEKGIIIPPNDGVKTESSIVGGYVKDPTPGLYKWLMSFDLTSLYPHVLMQFNMSPETLTREGTGNEIQRILDGDVDTSALIESNMCMAANGSMYTNSKLGIMPEVTLDLFNMRKNYKNIMLQKKRELESSEIGENQERLISEIAASESMQMALKIMLNSLYGASANPFFRYYNPHIAEGITMSGQLTTMYVEKRMNAFLNERFKTDGVEYVIYCDTDSVGGESEICTSLGRMKIEDLWSKVQGDVVERGPDNFVKKVEMISGMGFSDEPITAPIKYIMKHKVKKRMFEVRVGDKKVRCTEDHSIIAIRDGKMVSLKPTDLRKTDKLIKLV